MYATDDVNAKAKAKLTSHKQPAGVTAVSYCRAPWEKVVRSGLV